MISPVSFSRLPEVGTPCGHVYAARRRPPVTYVVLEVFEVRVRRAESRGREPGEPEAERPKGGCLQDTPDITNAFSGPATQRTIQMETEANRPFRWTPRSQKSKNDHKAVRPFLHPNLHRHISTVHTITITANPIVHLPTGYSRCHKATQVPAPLSSVARRACVCE